MQSPSDLVAPFFSPLPPLSGVLPEPGVTTDLALLYSHMLSPAQIVNAPVDR